MYSTYIHGYTREEKLRENIATSRHFHQSQEGLKHRNISSLSQKEQIDISRILQIILFPVPQKAS